MIELVTPFKPNALDDVPIRLYAELHITCDAPGPTGSLLENKRRDRFKRVAESGGWRASEFDEDDVDGYHGKWFLSAREELSTMILDRMQQMLDRLRTEGFKPIRWKAEDTLFDSKYGDYMV